MATCLDRSAKTSHPSFATRLLHAGHNRRTWAPFPRTVSCNFSGNEVLVHEQSCSCLFRYDAATIRSSQGFNTQGFQFLPLQLAKYIFETSYNCNKKPGALGALRRYPVMLHETIEIWLMVAMPNSAKNASARQPVLLQVLTSLLIFLFALLNFRLVAASCLVSPESTNL